MTDTAKYFWQVYKLILAVMCSCVGVHNLLQLMSAVLSDVSILFISSSYTALTGATRALSAIIHPLQLS